MTASVPSTGRDAHDHVPSLDTGLTLLHTPGPRSTALHRVALQAIADHDGPAYWIDARNTASTYALHELAPNGEYLDSIRLARAFTAYQHVSLIERVVNAVAPRTGTIIVPNVASLYRDDDVPTYDADPLLEAVTDALATVAEAYDIAVLLTDAGPDDSLQECLREVASTEVHCERTKLGYRFEGEDVETTVYWQDGAWQTTIPYWVDLFGTVADRPTAAITGPQLQLAVEG